MNLWFQQKVFDMAWPLRLSLLIVSLFVASSALALNFKTKKIKLGKKTITVEIADTNSKRTQGLMNRKKLKKDNGMLFIFNNEDYRRFWMKKTFIPLDIAYFSKKKILLEIYQAKPIKSIKQKSIPQYPSKNKAMYVLEMNQGWFKQNKIKAGTAFSY